MKRILSLLITALFVCQYAWAVWDDTNSYLITTKVNYTATLEPYNGYTGDFVVPETVVYNGDTYTIDEVSKQCFQNNNITSVTFPNTVKTIGSTLFLLSTPVVSVTLGSGVSSIDPQAFGQCSASSFTTITVDPANPNFSSADGVLYDKEQTTLLRCPPSNIISTVPNTVKTIGTSAFYNWRGFSLTLPEGLETIEEYAFQVAYLSSIDLPSTLTTLGNAAIVSDWLASITVAQGNPVFSTHDGALYNADQTTLLTFPCRKTTAESFPSTLTTIGESAFAKTRLSTFKIPTTVTTISNLAFMDAELTSIVIPDNVVELGESAFFRSNIQSISFGSGLTEIPGSAFYWSKLTSVTIPDNITSIKSSAFYGCSRLTSVDLGAGITNIGGYAFDGCSVLASVTCRATTLPTLNSYSGLKGITLKVPGDVIGDYIKNSIWGATYNTIEAYDCDVTIIDGTEYSALRGKSYNSLCYYRELLNNYWKPYFVPFKTPIEKFEEYGLEIAVFTQLLSYGNDVFSLKYKLYKENENAGSYLNPNTIAMVRTHKYGAKSITFTTATQETLTDDDPVDLVMKDDDAIPSITLTFCGTYEGVNGIDMYENSFYGMRSGVLARVASSASTSDILLKPQRWYAKVHSAPTSAPSFRIESEDDLVVDYGTDMLTVDNGDGTIEMFFSLDGRHLEAKDIQNLKPGIYVQNGKKMMVK